MNKLTPGAVAEYMAEHPEELEVQQTVIKRFINEVEPLTQRTKLWVREGIDLANDWHEVGTFYNELCDSLPGTKMTIDLWQQYKPLFMDKGGKQIDHDQLEWASKMAKSTPEGFKSIADVFSCRQGLLGSAGFELEGGEAPGTVEHKVHFYNKLFAILDAKKLDGIIAGIESDKNYGPLETWDSERKTRVFVQLEPFFAKVHAIETLLKPIDV